MADMFSYFLGKDGFHWFIGVCEDRDDPETLGRVRCRVFGYHTDDLTKLPVFEPGLDDVIKDCRNKNLFFSTKIVRFLYKLENFFS